MYTKKILLGFSALIFTFLVNTAFAASQIFVSTDQDTTITIDVSASLTAIESDFAAINLPAASSAGGSLAQVGSSAQFIYTPMSGYSGADSFSYQLLDAVGGNVLGTGSVVIAVGPIDTGIVQGAPSQAIESNLKTICLQNTTTGENVQVLVDLCADFTQATEGERGKLVNELAPKEVGGQNQLSSSVAKQQIDNIRKRMASLRMDKGATGIDVSALNFQLQQNRALNVANILGKGRGGAASADSGSQRFGSFFGGKLGDGRHTGSGVEDGYDINSRGLSGGVDYRLNSEAVIGAALGINRSQLLADNSGGSTDIGGYSLLAYGSYYMSSKSYLEAVIAFHFNTIDASRNVSYEVLGQTRQSNAISETGNDILSLSLGVGYEMFSRRGLTMNISANLDHIQSAFDGYAESGASSANLIIDKRELTQTTYSLNTSATYVINGANGVTIPQVDFIWKHEFDDKADVVQGRFRNDPNKVTFQFNTETPDTDYFKLNVGVSHVVPGGNTGYIYYEKLLGKSSYSESNLSLGMRLPLPY